MSASIPTDIVPVTSCFRPCSALTSANGDGERASSRHAHAIPASSGRRDPSAAAARYVLAGACVVLHYSAGQVQVTVPHGVQVYIPVSAPQAAHPVYGWPQV